MIGMSQYAKWVGTPEGAERILKSYQPQTHEFAAPMASSPDSLTLAQVNDLQMYQGKFDLQRNPHYQP